MMITNFAAGELSENLFGRVDLPQYFSGAARLENFDVIPTGGIERRAGTERLLGLEADGRLIPFAIDRLNHVLLFLTPGRIQIIQNGIIRKIIESPSLYATLDEIKEVQYAQNFDTMILVHENYAPLQVKYKNGTIEFSPLSIRYGVEIKADEAIDTSSIWETDKIYANNDHLRAAGNFPRTVTFFNGRLLLGGTKKNPQRIFASKTGDISSYATYKLYLTERRSYIVVHGTVLETSDVIKMESTTEGLQFTKQLEEYYVDSSYFPPGTRVKELRGDELIVTHPSLVKSLMTEAEEIALNEMLNTFNAANENRPWVYAGNVSTAIGQFEDATFGFYIGASKVSVAAWKGSNKNIYIREYELPYYAAKEAEEEREEEGKGVKYLLLFLKEKVKKMEEDSGIWLCHYKPDPDVMWKIAGEWNKTVQKTMKFKYRGDTHYNYAPEIIKEIDKRNADSNKVYIPLYTKEIVEDRYPSADDGFTFEIASDMSDAIRWMAVNKGVIVGTETAEWILPPEVSAVNLYAILNSQYGSDKIQGTVIGDAACFFQTGKKSLVEYFIPQQDNNFRANNMAMLSFSMLGESPAGEFDFIRAPYTKLFIVREDGTAVTLLYERNTGTFAWGRFVTAGKLKSAAVLPGADGNDDLYLLVERDGLYYLEVLREAAEVYLDSFRRRDGNDEEGAVVAGEYTGCPYTSVIRTMPVLANTRMQKQRITTLSFRFLRSFFPRVTSITGGQPIKTDVITLTQKPFTGIHRMPFPGSWAEDVQIELVSDQPEPVRILAINAEVQ